MPLRSRIFITVFAGLVGITVNTIALELVRLLNIDPGTGGLFQLFQIAVQRWSPSIEPSLRVFGLSRPPSAFGTALFHYATGLGIILFYFWSCAPLMKGSWLRRASLFSLLPWLLNAAVVLPVLGDGFAGLRTTAPVGVGYFFFANWLFIAVSELVYVLAAFLGRSGSRRRDLADRAPKGNHAAL